MNAELTTMTVNEASQAIQRLYETQYHALEEELRMECEKRINAEKLLNEYQNNTKEQEEDLGIQHLQLSIDILQQECIGYNASIHERLKIIEDNFDALQSRITTFEERQRSLEAAQSGAHGILHHIPYQLKEGIEQVKDLIQNNNNTIDEIRNVLNDKVEADPSLVRRIMKTFS